MNAEQFIAAYTESRNGANFFVRHPLVKTFTYSDGVQECAEAGCYWLLDILATELPAEFKKNAEVSNACMVKVLVGDSKATTITGEFEDGVIAWNKEVEYTDLPAGEWVFYVADDGEGIYACILLSEY